MKLLWACICVFSGNREGIFIISYLFRRFPPTPTITTCCSEAADSEHVYSILSDSFIIHSLLHPNFENRLHFSYWNFFLVTLPLPIYFPYGNTTFISSSFFPSHPLRILSLCLSLSLSLQLHQLRCYITIPTLQPVTDPPKLPLLPRARFLTSPPPPELTTFLPPPQFSLTCGRSTSNRAIIYLFTQNFLVYKGRYVWI